MPGPRFVIGPAHADHRIDRVVADADRVTDEVCDTIAGSAIPDLRAGVLDRALVHADDLGRDAVGGLGMVHSRRRPAQRQQQQQDAPASERLWIRGRIRMTRIMDEIRDRRCWSRHGAVSGVALKVMSPWAKK